MSSVVKYFNGEKAESFVFIAIGIVALIMAFYFIVILKTSFWRGVALPFMLVALLEFIVGYTIVKRSPKDISRVESFIKVQPSKIASDEIPRMEKVMKNFVVFRYVEICLIVLGIILMYSSLNDTFWRGIGLGLFIQASIVLSLDFFAERRGHEYLYYLTEVKNAN
jgi:hypothetical protein